MIKNTHNLEFKSKYREATHLFNQRRRVLIKSTFVKNSIQCSVP